MQSVALTPDEIQQVLITRQSSGIMIAGQDPRFEIALGNSVQALRHALLKSLEEPPSQIPAEAPSTGKRRERRGAVVAK